MRPITSSAVLNSCSLPSVWVVNWQRYGWPQEDDSNYQITEIDSLPGYHDRPMRRQKLGISFYKPSRYSSSLNHTDTTWSGDHAFCLYHNITIHKERKKQTRPQPQKTSLAVINNVKAYSCDELFAE